MIEEHLVKYLKTPRTPYEISPTLRKIDSEHEKNGKEIRRHILTNTPKKGPKMMVPTANTPEKSLNTLLTPSHEFYLGLSLREKVVHSHKCIVFAFAA